MQILVENIIAIVIGFPLTFMVVGVIGIVCTFIGSIITSFKEDLIDD